MANHVAYMASDSEYQHRTDEEDSETEPKNEPISQDYVNFKNHFIRRKNDYSSSEDLKQITPSAISAKSTPSTSISSHTGSQNTKYNHNSSWGRADRHPMEHIELNNITRLGSSGTLVRDTDDNYQEIQTEGMSLKRFCKYCIAVAIMLLGIAAVIVVIVMNKDEKLPKADRQTQPAECGIYIINTVQYGQPVNIEFNCTLNTPVNLSTTLINITIEFEPIYRYLNASQYFKKVISLGKTNGKSVNDTTITRWNISCTVGDNHLKCDLDREPVRCDNGGNITVTLHKDAGKLFQEEIKYDVEGEISEVQMSVNQTKDENDNTTIVDIACSTQSSCTPTSIWLFSEKGGVTQRRFDINFTCIIEYNTQDGTNVECTGSVPGSLIKSFDTILCRPLLNDSKKAEDKQASVRPPVCVGDECTFSCPDEGADIFYMDPLDCTVLHRCADRRLYSGICANSTYFNPSKCTCDHKNNVQGCNEDGKRIEKLKDTRCGDSAINN